MRNSDAGFTLVETLVALALVAMVSLLLFEGMRFTNTAWQSRAARTEALSAAIAASDALRAMSDAAIDPALQQDVVGQPHSLQWITVLPPPNPGTRGAQIVVIAQEGDQLIAQARDIGTGTPHARRVLAEGVADIGFRYLNRAGDWTQTWEAADRLPRLIEIRITVDGLRHWPAIVVAPGPDLVPD